MSAWLAPRFGRGFFVVCFACVVGGLLVVQPARAGREHWPEFYDYIDDKDFHAAAAYAEAYNFYYLGDLEDLLQAGIALKLIGEYEESRRLLQLGVVLSNHEPRLVYELATAQYLLSEWDVAEENLRSLIGSDLPADAREQIYLFLRDIRSHSTTRFDLEMALGRDNNANSVGARRYKIFIFNYSSPPPEKIWYLDVTPSFYIQRQVNTRTGVWFRPSLALRWASNSKYGQYTVAGEAGLNYTKGPWLVRPSVRWSRTEPNEGDKSRVLSARFAVRRALGRAAVEPFVVRRWHRFQDSVLRTRDRELGINLTYNFTANVSGGVQPSVSLRDEVFIDTNTRQERWRLWFHITRDSWSFAPSYTTWRTKHSKSQLQFASPLPLPNRADSLSRIDFTLGNSRWDFRGYSPDLRIFSERHKSNDPRQDRKREFGFSIGLRKLF